jgi:hypothetical protein
MNYPTGFPHHLEPPVDEAIATAEIAFFEAKSKLMSWRANNAELLIFAFVKPVFFAFAHQMSKAVEERRKGWSQERVRRELDIWLRLLIVHAWKDKHPNADSVNRDFMQGSVQKIKDSEEWRKLHIELRRVALRLQEVPPARLEEIAIAQPTKPLTIPATKARQVRDPKPELLANLDTTLSRLRSAEALGISRRTLDRWVLNHKLKPVGLGHRKRFRTKDLRKLLDQKLLDKRDTH